MVGMAFAALLIRYLIFAQLSGQYGPLNQFLRNTCLWDCGLYRIVSTGGYEAISNRPDGLAITWAFFPLRPLIDSTAMQLTGWYFEAATFLTGTVLTIAAAWLARPWFKRERDGWLFGAYLLVGPLVPILSSAYTESLFLLLTILGLSAVRQRRYVTAGGVGSLLSATRSTGALLAIALLTQAVADHFRDGGKIATLPSALLSNTRLMIGLALCPVGLLAFMAFMHFHTGDALAFLHAQAIWGRSIAWPWGTIIRAIENLWPGHAPNALWVIHSISLLAALALCGALMWKNRPAEAAFCFTVLLIAAAGGFTSTTRFVLGLAPFTILLIEFLSNRHWSYWLAYPLIVALCVASTFGWLTGAMIIV